MKLIQIQDCDVKQAYQVYQGFEKDENGFINDAYGMDLEQFQQFIQKCIDSSKGINLPANRVPQTTYLLQDGDKLVGVFKLRHYLNEALANGAGHIGYGIHRDYRGQGYGKKGLALACEKAIEMGIEEIYISCHVDNPASHKVIESNGFIYHHEDEREFYFRKKVKKD